MQREILKNFIDRSTAGGKKSKDGSGELLHTNQTMMHDDEEQDYIDAKRLSRYNNHNSKQSRPSLARPSLSQSGRITTNDDVFNLH